MTDNQIDMADCSDRAAERNSISDAKMKRAELTFIFQFDPAANFRVRIKPDAKLHMAIHIVVIVGLQKLLKPASILAGRIDRNDPATDKLDLKRFKNLSARHDRSIDHDNTFGRSFDRRDRCLDARRWRNSAGLMGDAGRGATFTSSNIDAEVGGTVIARHTHMIAFVESTGQTHDD